MKLMPAKETERKQTRKLGFSASDPPPHLAGKEEETFDCDKTTLDKQTEAHNAVSCGPWSRR